MAFSVFFLGGVLLVGLLLSSMGMPFEEVLLSMVALPLVALFGMLVVMQMNENRIKKRFEDKVRPRSKRSRWYNQRAYRWGLGLLTLGAVAALVMNLTGQTVEPDSALSVPVTHTAIAQPTAPPPVPAPVPAAEPAPVPAPMPAPVVSATQPTDMRGTAEAAVQAWAKAWSAGDVELYLGLYSASFQPAGNQTRTQWERTRRARVTPAQQIRIDLDELTVDLTSETQAQVQFVQRYAAKSLQDRSRKQLDLVLENGHWKITAETVLTTLAPESSTQ